MKKTVNNKNLHNLMTLATDYNCRFFSHSICYQGLYCLFSVAVVKEAMPSFCLRENQVVLVSPIIDNQDNNDQCTVYRTDVNAESGLLLPYISWALEFTRQILTLDITVKLVRRHGLMERILVKIWEYEEVKLSAEGLHIDLNHSDSWESMIDKSICWDNYDALAQAEILLKNGVISIEELILPHVHVENIDYFRRAGVTGEVVFDW